jgi:hypothetical protein
LLDVGAFLDEQPAHLLALRAGLVRDQLHAQDLRGQLRELGGRARELDAATLAAAAGVDLRLDHPQRAAQPLCGFLGFADAEGRVAARHRHPVLAQQLLGLVFVDLHRGWPACPATREPCSRSRGQLGVLAQELAGVVLALADLLAVVGVPGAGLVEDARQRPCR